MRYSIIAKGMTTDQIIKEVEKVGAGNVSRTKLLNGVFCDLDDQQAEKLVSISGLKVKPVKEYKPDQVNTETPVIETVADVFFLLRSYFSPALTGIGLTVAVLDTGVRKTHQSLLNKVVYEANFTDSLTTNDVFGHGT
jgi:serine protease AprX